MIRSSVDLPQPEAPIRQTNSPLSMTRFTPRSAATSSMPIWNVLPTSRTARKGRRGTVDLSMMLGAPPEHAIVDGDDEPVRCKACDPDHDHACDHEVRP